jgi:serine/threonine protein kinase
MANPTTIGEKYTVVRRLGKGGMGTVFEAIEEGTGHRVAIKVIAADLAEDPALVTRFHREARTVAALDTPHVVKVLDTGVDHDTQLPFMVMEYLEGEDLRQLLKRLGPLPAELALRIAAQACRALDLAHQQKILHRDIKPANLFLARRDGQRVVKLLDFGVAKIQHGELTGDAEQTNLTRTGSMIGSPLYMSPEQAKGYKNIDGRSDLWSLGVVLYQMLCGRTPHAKIDELGELLVRICTMPPPPIQRRAPWVPPSVAGLLRHALAMEPEDRFANANDLLDAILVLLPNGDRISEEALRPLSDAERAVGIDRTPSMEIEIANAGQYDPLAVSGGTQLTGSGPIRTMPGNNRSPSLSGEQQGVEQITGPTGAGNAAPTSTLTNGATSMTGNTAAPVAPPDKKGWRIAVAGLVAGGVAAGVYLGVARPPGTQADGAPISTVAATDNKPRAVKLFVLPKDAKVEVEGTPVEASDGLLELKGNLGSVHKVRVTAGGETKLVEVAITDNGPVPPKIEIDVKVPAPATATAAPTAAASASASATAQSASFNSYTPKPKPTVSSAPTIVPTSSGSRTLRDDR